MADKNNELNEYLETHTIILSESYAEFKWMIQDNMAQVKKELWNERVVFEVVSNESKKIYENLINELNFSCAFHGLEISIYKNDLFLLHLIKEISESPISSERFKEVKEYIFNNESEIIELRCAVAMGYHMVIVITQENIFFVTFDEYIENINSFWFWWPSIAIFLKHFIHYEERKISGIDQVLHTYFDDEYKELKLSKRDEYNSLEWTRVLWWKDIKFTELQKKYPHAKIEFQTYKGNTDKYIISEKFKLKKTK